MTVSTDPRYQALARGVASKLGGGPDLTRAVLGQWQCELGAGDAYPPRRNNPGNLARGFATGLGFPFTVESPNPQPGNPIVTFRSPEAGASAYVKGLQTYPRYRTALAAARRDDGRGFLQAVTAAGWGTSAACALSVYGSAPTSSGPGAILVIAPGDAAGKTLANLFTTSKPTAPFTEAMLQLLIGEIPTDNPQRDQLIATYRSYIGRPLNTIPFQPRTFYSPGGGLLGPTIGDVGGLLGNFDWVPVVLTNGAILAAIVGLGYLGLRSIITSPAKVGQ